MSAPKSETTAQAPASGQSEGNQINLKVGVLGALHAGKTSLLQRYINNRFGEQYLATLGVNFLTKSVQLKNANVTFYLYDLGGQQEFQSMLPIVCNDAACIIFCFDLTSKASLVSLGDWYKQARALNQVAVPILVGTKYDLFSSMTEAEQRSMLESARAYANAMNAPLVFSSSKYGIHINNIFKIALSKIFKINLNLERISTLGEPILEY
ncbi:hypothetical protein PCE1_003743 [Barthelona sp. PCE]